MSHTHSRFGSLRANSRSTRSGAEGRLASRTVVVGPPRRPAPKMPRAHQTRHALLADANPVGNPQLGVNSWRPADAEGGIVDLGDPGHKSCIGNRARTWATIPPDAVAGARDAHRSAQQGDGKLCGLFVDEPEPHGVRSLSLAKNTAARRRSSRSWRRSLFSRSSSRRRGRSSLDRTSPRSPRSASSWRRQSVSVCSEQPSSAASCFGVR